MIRHISSLKTKTGRIYSVGDVGITEIEEAGLVFALENYGRTFATIYVEDVYSVEYRYGDNKLVRLATIIDKLKSSCAKIGLSQELIQEAIKCLEGEENGQ